MPNVRVRPETGKLYFDFQYQKVRCREASTLDDTPQNRVSMEKVLERIEAEITLGTFDYRRYFPNSPKATLFDSRAQVTAPNGSDPPAGSTPAFSAFVADWWAENEVRWRAGTKETMRATVYGRLKPRFGDARVASITRQDILRFRAELAQEKGRGTAALSPKTVNQIVTVLKAILDEAAQRYGFVAPTGKIARLKVPKTDIEPFTLDEVWSLINTVRADYKPYLTVRLFTGMRTGEANGLKWKHVDWARRQILVRETYRHGRTEYTKTDGSQREIDISDRVLAALKEQQALGHQSEYVFCNREGGPIDAKNFANRVWAPLLRHLGLKVRRPYQMRHTCATLWLAAGENPLWIARQLGHSTPEMLFKVYSRFVPNLTRRDGSAFERLIARQGELA